MIICSKCKAVVNDGACPICGRKKFVTEAKEDDLVLLTTADYVSSFLIEDVLNDAGIKFLKKGELGSAVTLYIGELTESFNFFVMANDYDEALAVLPNMELDEEAFDDI